MPMTANVISLEARRAVKRGEKPKSALRLHIEWLAGLTSNQSKRDDAAKARQHRILQAWLAETAEEFGATYAADELRVALARAENMKVEQ